MAAAVRATTLGSTCSALWTYEGQCNQSNHDNALLEQRLALDCLMGVQLHDRSLLFGGYAHLLAVHNVEHQQRNKQDDEHWQGR